MDRAASLPHPLCIVRVARQKRENAESSEEGGRREEGRGTKADRVRRVNAANGGARVRRERAGIARLCEIHGEINIGYDPAKGETKTNARAPAQTRLARAARLFAE